LAQRTLGGVISGKALLTAEDGLAVDLDRGPPPQTADPTTYRQHAGGLAGKIADRRLSAETTAAVRLVSPALPRSSGASPAPAEAPASPPAMPRGPRWSK